jgi:hypothetical protein
MFKTGLWIRIQHFNLTRIRMRTQIRLRIYAKIELLNFYFLPYLSVVKRNFIKKRKVCFLHFHIFLTLGSGYLDKAIR